MVQFAYLAVVLQCACSSAWALNLPSTFKRCPVSPALDNKPNECLKDAIYGALVQLTKGNQELGVGTLDPLKVKNIKLEQGANSPISIKLTFKDCDLYGVRNLEIDSITGHPSSAESFYLKGSGHTPQLVLAGPYKISGKILLLPVHGHGMSNLTLDNVKAEYSLKAEAQVKDGVKYLKVKNLKLNIKSTSRLWMSFEGLFNGDKVLGDNMNVLVNENWKDIFAELRPSINSAFGSVVEEYAKKIMENVPFDSIFITT